MTVSGVPWGLDKGLVEPKGLLSGVLSSTSLWYNRGLAAGDPEGLLCRGLVRGLIDTPLLTLGESSSARLSESAVVTKFAPGLRGVLTGDTEDGGDWEMEVREEVKEDISNSSISLVVVEGTGSAFNGPLSEASSFESSFERAESLRLNLL